MGEVKLDGINIVVTGMPAAVDFYRRLGLEVQEPPAPWAGHHRQVGPPGDHAIDLDSTAFAAVWDRGWSREVSGVVVNFRVLGRDEVDRLHAELTAAGHTSAQAPYDAFWGARYAVLLDPSGNHIGLMSEPDPAKRSAPPDPTTF